MQINKKTSKNNKKEIKNNENDNLTYTLSNELGKLFPQFKPSKKKEEDKK
jgi:hypothetical protein